MLCLYTVSDLIGRFSTLLLTKKKIKNKQIIIASLLRMILIYTSLMIGMQESPKWLFDADWFKIINNFLIGFGNGFLGSLLMILGPQRVSNYDSERAGQIMAFHMTLGRGLGSMISGVGLYQVFK